MAEPFIGPDDFIVPNYSKAKGPVATGLQSTYDGTIVVTMVDRDDVLKMLPPGFDVDVPATKPVTGPRTNAPTSPTTPPTSPTAPPTTPSTPPTSPSASPSGPPPAPPAKARHPIIYLMGSQRDPCTVADGRTFNVGAGYYEVILLVPFVLHDAYSGWHNYAARMYLDSDVAVFNGNLLYGYSKRLAVIDHYPANDELNFTVSSLDLTKQWFAGTIKQMQPLQPFAEAVANVPRLDEILQIMQMPILGLISAPSGRYPACSYWEWTFEDAEFAEVSCDHQMITSFCKGGENIAALGKLSNAESGAVMMFGVRWRLGVPAAAC